MLRSARLLPNRREMLSAQREPVLALCARRLGVLRRRLLPVRLDLLSGRRQMCQTGVYLLSEGDLVSRGRAVL